MSEETLAEVENETPEEEAEGYLEEADEDEPELEQPDAPESEEPEQPEAELAPENEGERSIEELQADFDADKPMRPRDVRRLADYHQQRAESQRTEESRRDAITNAVPNAAKSIIDSLESRFNLNPDQKDAVTRIVEQHLLHGDNALRETIGASILTPIVSMMGGQLIAAGATEAEIQQTEAKDFIALAVKVAERKLVASGEYVKKNAVDKAKTEGRKEGRAIVESANPERAAPAPGAGERSSKPKSFEQLRAGYGTGTNSDAEDREYLRLRDERAQAS